MLDYSENRRIHKEQEQAKMEHRPSCCKLHSVCVLPNLRYEALLMSKTHFSKLLGLYIMPRSIMEGYTSVIQIYSQLFHLFLHDWLPIYRVCQRPDETYRQLSDSHVLHILPSCSLVMPYKITCKESHKGRKLAMFCCLLKLSYKSMKKCDPSHKIEKQSNWKIRVS